MIHALFRDRVLRTRGAHFALATVEKLPLDAFNEWYLAPYTEHPVLSLAELSALSAERPHGACFGAVVLMKVRPSARPPARIQSSRQALACSPTVHAQIKGGPGLLEESADKVRADTAGPTLALRRTTPLSA